MTQKELKKQIGMLDAQLRKAREQLTQMQNADLEAACARGERVVAYPMITGTRYVCGKQTYWVTHRNSHGEHKIMKGMTGKTLVGTTRNPVKMLTELFGVSAYRAPALYGRKR